MQHEKYKNNQNRKNNQKKLVTIIHHLIRIKKRLKLKKKYQK